MPAAGLLMCDACATGGGMAAAVGENNRITTPMTLEMEERIWERRDLYIAFSSMIGFHELAGICCDNQFKHIPRSF